MYEVKIRRAYIEKGEEDGYNILVDRLWPRGIKKEDLSFSWWPKEIAPSDELRERFGHDKDKFNDFKKSYKKELEDNDIKDAFLDKVKTQLKKHNVTLVYGAKDEEHNQAVVLKEWIKKALD
ncbi:DUF488 family protein [Psychrobacter okhotskensis]|uniref:DUF488 domain-containing protein n=1 Tax=Psychrobacter okhotskensis TaxID=212403 RepID=UPI0015633063|nr:DUF488 family protein [Psychrobacter okhotskensis]NRD70265.1 DUF488 family protein [Psychrobacter okhotskensis]